MSEQSENLQLPYIIAAQAQKHVTHNEALRNLDAIVQIGVIDRDDGQPPTSPNSGERYIVGPNATGAWEGKENQIAAFQDGAWEIYQPQIGWVAWIVDEGVLVVFDGVSWLLAGSGDSVPKLGINGTADTTNRLLVNSPAALFNNVGNGFQLKINKAAVSDNASLLFQTAFSGRAEIGLSGDDNLHFKTSSNGTSFESALIIKNTNGYTGFGTANPATRVHVYGTTSTSSRLTVERNGSGSGAFGALNGLFLHARAPIGGSSISFWTTPSSDKKQMELHNDGGLVMRGASGGSKGEGTINARAVYDDGALLSCYVFEQANKGTVNLQDWDDKVPDLAVDPTFDLSKDLEIGAAFVEKKRHEFVRRFCNRIGTEYDPLTLKGYARHWKEKGHLTSLPNETKYDALEAPMSSGEWIQRLVETVEIQAVLIEHLNQKIDVLENKVLN